MLTFRIHLSTKKTISLTVVVLLIVTCMDLLKAPCRPIGPARPESSRKRPRTIGTPMMRKVCDLFGQDVAKGPGKLAKCAKLVDVPPKSKSIAV